jgi:hypothetical protein
MLTIYLLIAFAVTMSIMIWLLLHTKEGAEFHDIHKGDMVKWHGRKVMFLHANEDGMADIRMGKSNVFKTVPLWEIERLKGGVR